MKATKKDGREGLIQNNVGLVHSIAKRFMGRQEYEDLVEVGKIGLIKAIDGFDEGLGYSFSTYAYPLIIGEIKRFLRDDGIIKVSRQIKKNSGIIAKAAQDYQMLHGTQPKISYLCEATKLTEEEVLQAIDASSAVLSLQEKIAGDDSDMTLGDVLQGDDDISDLTDRLALKQALDVLSEFERHLIELRFFRGLTQCQTAHILGVSQVTVSRGEKKAIERLREEIVV